MFRTSRQIADSLVSEYTIRTSHAALEGAALRGELGADAQRIAIAAKAEQYRQLKAEGRIEEARQIKALVLALVPME